jgi:hypothetical protein
MSTAYEWIGFFWVATLALAAAAILPPRSWPAWLRRFVLLAVMARIVSSTARLFMVSDIYGRGDALRYYRKGELYADLVYTLDGRLFTEEVRGTVRWWGTQFVEYVTGFVVAFTGPSIRAAFLVYSLFSLVGLLLIVLSFANAFPTASPRRFAMLALFWPSLAFWPASIGKEAVILLAAGLVTYGYFGNGGRRSGPLLGLGLLIAAGIRPHIAMMMAVSLGAAEWLGPASKWSAGRVARALVLAIVAAVTVQAALTQFGLEAAETEEIQQFVEFHSGQTVAGGSKIEQVSGAAGVPMAFVNVLLRPFPWEARNPMVLLSSLEVLFLWSVAWRRRRSLMAAFGEWRQNRLLQFTVPLAVVLTFFYGYFVSNLGILARQRVVILPFLFLFLEATPRAAAFAQRTYARARRGVAMRGRVSRRRL